MTASHYTADGLCPVHNTRAVGMVQELPAQWAGVCPYCARRITTATQPAWLSPAPDRLKNTIGPALSA